MNAERTRDRRGLDFVGGGLKAGDVAPSLKNENSSSGEYYSKKRTIQKWGLIKGGFAVQPNKHGDVTKHYWTKSVKGQNNLSQARLPAER